MPGLRVIYFVHPNRVCTVIDGDVHMAANGLLDACGCPATTGKKINDKLGR